MQQRHHYQILHPDSPLGKLTRELELPPLELQQKLLHKAYDIESASDSYNEYVQLL